MTWYSENDDVVITWSDKGDKW